MIVVLAALLVATLAACSNKSGGDGSGREDPGVTACKMSADDARNHTAPDEARTAEILRLLAASEHEDIRKTGTTMYTLGDIIDVTQVTNAVNAYVSACASAGVTVPMNQ